MIGINKRRETLLLIINRVGMCSCNYPKQSWYLHTRPIDIIHSHSQSFVVTAMAQNPSAWNAFITIALHASMVFSIRLVPPIVTPIERQLRISTFLQTKSLPQHSMLYHFQLTLTHEWLCMHITHYCLGTARTTFYTSWSSTAQIKHLTLTIGRCFARNWRLYFIIIKN